MKILYYSSHPTIDSQNPSGPGTHIREMIIAFQELGHEVFTLTSADNKIASPFSSAPKTSFTKILKKILPTMIWETIKDYRYLQHDKAQKNILTDQIKLFSPDAIYERASYLHQACIQTAMKFNIPVITELNADFAEEKLFFDGNSFYRSRAEKIIDTQLKHSKKIVTVSSALKNHFVKKYNANPEKIIVTPNAVNPSNIHIDEKKIDALRNKLNLKEKIVIGFSGSIFEYHGVDLLIHSFARIHKKNNNTCLLIVGDGRVLNDLKRLASQLQIESSVIFTGNVNHSDIFHYIELMDIAVMPNSNWYGSPVKIFEYGALGKAIIAPDNEPMREVMKNGKDGILISPSIDNLTNAMNKFIADENLRKETGKAFQQKVLNEHTWKKMAEKIIFSFAG